MTRYWFGDSDDTVYAEGPNREMRLRAATKKYYEVNDDGTVGPPVTDLLIDGTTPATAVATDGTPVRFKGPDGVLFMWVRADDGPPVLVMSTDVPKAVQEAVEQVIAVGVTNDGVMAMVTDNPVSAFRAALEAAMAELLVTFSPGAVQDYATRDVIFTSTNTTLGSTAAASIIGGLELTVLGTGRPVDLALHLPFRHSAGAGAYFGAYLIASVNGAADSSTVLPQIAVASVAGNNQAGNRTMDTTWLVNTVEGVTYTFKVGVYGPTGTITLETLGYPMTFEARNH